MKTVGVSSLRRAGQPSSGLEKLASSVPRRPGLWGTLSQSMSRPNDPNVPGREDVIEDLLEAWEREFPDPVDFFEDELARRLGLVRHPHCSPASWQRHRVRLIDAAEISEDLIDQVGELCDQILDG